VRRRYVETSALVRGLLEDDASVRPLVRGSGLFTSALTFLEAARALSRAVREGRIDATRARDVEKEVAAFRRACDVVEVDADVLQRAGVDWPHEPVRSLDAIHLASLRAMDVELGDAEVVSCDDRVRRNASALGFDVLPA
jgi:predicted nucleic acid-binding protein